MVYELEPCSQFRAGVFDNLHFHIKIDNKDFIYLEIFPIISYFSVTLRISVLFSIIEQNPL